MQEVVAVQQLQVRPSVASTVVIFLGTLLTEMVGLYLLTRLALQLVRPLHLVCYVCTLSLLRSVTQVLIRICI